MCECISISRVLHSTLAFLLLCHEVCKRLIHLEEQPDILSCHLALYVVDESL